MPAERLWIVQGDEVIADLERTDDQQLLLSYRAAVVDRSPGAPALSVSLPVRTQPYGGPALLPFFEGLLPEGRTRARLAARFRLDESDA
ncbi:MAG: HipA N-terminal domain-containing protein, partial [Chloroflexota bacterium]